jgi:hypothetical protein
MLLAKCWIALIRLFRARSIAVVVMGVILVRVDLSCLLHTGSRNATKVESHWLALRNE